jgi:hypothetical protein
VVITRVIAVGCLCCPLTQFKFRKSERVLDQAGRLVRIANRKTAKAVSVWTILS